MTKHELTRVPRCTNDILGPLQYLLVSTGSSPRDSHTRENTTFGLPTALMRRSSPRCSICRITGIELCANVWKRFRMEALLSSERPDHFPRLRSLHSIHASGSSRKSISWHGSKTASNESRFSSERGKPSMRIGPAHFVIALRRSRTVTSDLTICPSSITCAISRPVSDPSFISCANEDSHGHESALALLGHPQPSGVQSSAFASFCLSPKAGSASLLTCSTCRRRSPAERCTSPKCFASLLHCVPLPLPGPPITK